MDRGPKRTGQGIAWLAGLIVLAGAFVWLGSFDAGGFRIICWLAALIVAFFFGVKAYGELTGTRSFRSSRTAN